MVSFAILLRSDPQKDGYQFWMQKRSEKGALDQLWEFPGGKIEAQESPKDACLREVREETGYQASELQMQLFKVYPFTYPDRSVCLYPFLVWAPEFGDKPTLGEWVDVNQEGLASYKLLPANEKICQDVITYLGEQGPAWREQWQK